MTDHPHPQRLHHRRTKGADMRRDGLALNGLPTTLVAYTSRWANPFKWKVIGRPEANAQFRRLVDDSPPGSQWHRETIPRHLRGWNLACPCKPGEECHADYLLTIANAEEPSWMLLPVALPAAGAAGQAIPKENRDV
jgi:hypothetical protein